jgi:hypothetical protein
MASTPHRYKALIRVDIEQIATGIRVEGTNSSQLRSRSGGLAQEVDRRGMTEAAGIAEFEAENARIQALYEQAHEGG